MLKNSEIIIEDFSQDHHLHWQVINDGVMGGISESIADHQSGNFNLKIGWIKVSK
jgi:hypothetical protein